MLVQCDWIDVHLSCRSICGISFALVSDSLGYTLFFSMGQATMKLMCSVFVFNHWLNEKLDSVCSRELHGYTVQTTVPIPTRSSIHSIRSRDECSRSHTTSNRFHPPSKVTKIDPIPTGNPSDTRGKSREDRSHSHRKPMLSLCSYETPAVRAAKIDPIPTGNPCRHCVPMAAGFCRCRAAV